MWFFDIRNYNLILYSSKKQKRQKICFINFSHAIKPLKINVEFNNEEINV